MIGKVDQMSREEVEARLSQLMGNVVLEDKTDPEPDLNLVDQQEEAIEEVIEAKEDDEHD